MGCEGIRGRTGARAWEVIHIYTGSFTPSPAPTPFYRRLISTRKGGLTTNGIHLLIPASLSNRSGSLLAQVLEEVLLRPAREHGAGAQGLCGWVVITGTWRPLTAPNLADRSPLRSYRFSARSTVVALVPAGPWISTSRVRKSSSGQSSPLKFLCQVMQAMPRRARRLNRSGLQPSRSNTRVSAARRRPAWSGRGPLPAPPPGAAGAAPRPALLDQFRVERLRGR